NTTEDDNIILKTTYIKKSGNEKWNETNFPTIEAQRLFPYWDKPIRATFNVSIKHHCNYSVFSNMPIRQEKIYKHKLNNTETCMQWTYFDTTPSIPAHLVMVMISSMHFYPNNGIDKDYFWRNPDSEHVQFAERVSNKIIMKLKFEWFKPLKKMKVPKLQLVAIPGFRNDINMNFGFVAIRETSVIYNENLHSVAHKIEVAQLIARGITYQWFGNLINLPWGSDLWLSDGLTTLFGIDVVNAVNALEHYKSSKMLDLFIVQAQYESLQLDDYNLTQSLLSGASSLEINSLASYSRYIKAPLILYMMQYLVTKEVFWKVVYRYLNMRGRNEQPLHIDSESDVLHSHHKSRW
ncbi:glutamyl aminopeptidase-like, partial [Formica exsecta]|uniref:glutamyl aminopeptidase-like n=1 Tax=Formica exsecta TaxID=72781 RepID=UPI0011428194